MLRTFLIQMGSDKNVPVAREPTQQDFIFWRKNISINREQKVCLVTSSKGFIVAAIKLTPSACIDQVGLIGATFLYSCNCLSHGEHIIEGEDISYRLKMGKKSVSALTG